VVLPRPKPAESAGGQQTIDETIDDFFDGYRPLLTLPDAVAQVPQAVGEERGGPGDAEDGQIACAGRNCVAGEIGDEESDQEAKDKPLDQKLRHRGRAAGKDGSVLIVRCFQDSGGCGSGPSLTGI